MYANLLQNDIADFLTGFVIDLDVTADRFTQGSTNGNVNPVDLRTFPVVSINGPNSAQVCEGKGERGRGGEGGRGGGGEGGRGGGGREKKRETAYPFISAMLTFRWRF